MKLASARAALSICLVSGWFLATPARAAEEVATANASAERPPAATLLDATWQFTTLGSSIGATGLSTAKIGTASEVYAGASSSGGAADFWYALRYAADGSAQTVFVSPRQPAAIVHVGLFHKKSRKPRIVVALADGTINLYDQVKKSLLSSTRGDCGLQAFTTADVDNDGNDEFVSICTNGYLEVLFPGHGKWVVPSVGGTDIVVANLDDSAYPQIATTSGAVVDTRKQNIRWRWQGGFGSHLRAAPLGGGRTGLVGVTSEHVITAFDVARKVPVWTLQPSFDIGLIEVADVDGDGVPELLVTGPSGISAYDLATQSPRGTFPTPASVAGLLVADVTGLGVADLVWSDGNVSANGGIHLYTGDWATRKVLWTSVDLDGPFIGPAVGDLDGDGKPELVFASTASDTYGSGRLIVVDGKTLKLRAMSQPVCDNASLSGLHDLKLRDLGSGRLSILLACDEGNQGELEAWTFDDATGFVRTWRNAVPANSPFMSVEAADIDGDGRIEVFGGADHSIYVYDATTGALEWQSLRMLGNNSPSGLAVGDFRGDGRTEVAAQADGADVYVFDGTTHAVDAAIQVAATALAVMDTKSRPQLLVGTASGNVQDYVPSSKKFRLKSNQAVSTEAVDAILVSSPENWWVGSGGVLTHWRKGAATAATDDYGPGFGQAIALLPGKKMVFGGGSYGVFGFPDQP